MPDRLRLATFNCENLFSRPKIFEEGPQRSRVLLELVAELQIALKNDVFDKPKIRELKQKLQGFARVVDLRGKHLSVTGAKQWLGYVEVTREELSDAAIRNVARVIAEVDADLICLIEIENRVLLQKFHDGLLVPEFLEPANKVPYEHVLLVDGNDERGIDVAFMSRLPVRWLQSRIHERSLYDGREVPTFSRDCLGVELGLRDGRPLHLLVNHFKSQGFSPPTDPQSERRRRGQAERVAELVSEHDLDQELLVVAGDLNADPSKGSMAPLVQHPGLFNVNLTLPATQRGTFRTGRAQLDYLFVSKPLRAALQLVRIERRGIFVKSRPHFDTVVDEHSSASDHGAVAADFMI